jgi:hypothetical protein
LGDVLGQFHRDLHGFSIAPFRGLRQITARIMARFSPLLTSDSRLLTPISRLPPMTRPDYWLTKFSEIRIDRARGGPAPKPWRRAKRATGCGGILTCPASGFRTRLSSSPPRTFEPACFRTPTPETIAPRRRDTPRRVPTDYGARGNPDSHNHGLGVIRHCGLFSSAVIRAKLNHVFGIARRLECQPLSLLGRLGDSFSRNEGKAGTWSPRMNTFLLSQALYHQTSSPMIRRAPASSYCGV